MRVKISAEAWKSWREHGFVVCPGSRRGVTCSSKNCLAGATCRALRALGQFGDRSPMPRKRRPLCGARNRQGKPCSVRVVLGKRRCRFHGGLSTGPKTEAGRARIAEAQRQRWVRWRQWRLILLLTGS